MRLSKKEWIDYKIGKHYWDKPSRNKNKLGLSGSEQKKLSTLFGKAKKNYLKELHRETVNN